MSSSLIRSTSVVSAMTLISRLLGFVRDVLQAALFGAGAGMDAFFVAFRIPNLFRRMFAEGAFSQAFVPVLTETRQQASEAEVKALVDVVAGTLGGFLLMLTAVAVLGAPALMWLFAPGFADTPEKFALGVEMLRWTFPYLLLISLTAFAGGILNSYGRFAVPAFTPVWLNVCLIAAALMYAPSALSLAIAVFVAGIVQLLFQLPSLIALGLLPRPRWAWQDPRVKRIIKMMLPIMFGSSVAQISLMLDSIIASFLPANGSVSWLWYADRLMEFPLGVFSIAIATVVLPALSAQYALRSEQQFSQTIDWSLRTVLVLGLPAALGLLLLAGPLVSTLFQHGEFTARDVQMTGWALNAYALGFLGFSFVKILVPGFYARHETSTPVRAGITALCISMSLSLTLVGILLWQDFIAPHAGIALATALGAWINATLLLRGLWRDGVFRPQPGWRRYAAQLGAAAVTMSAWIIWQRGELQWWMAQHWAERAQQLLLIIGGAVLIYFAVLLLMGLRPRHFRLS